MLPSRTPDPPETVLVTFWLLWVGETAGNGTVSTRRPEEGVGQDPAPALKARIGGRGVPKPEEGARAD